MKFEPRMKFDPRRMKLNPRKLLEDYDLLVWSGLFLCILALWSALFAIAIAYAILT